MIKVNVVSTDVIEKITVSGHSGYAEAGADIVCSAVSTAMYLSLGLIERSARNMISKVTKKCFDGTYYYRN